MGGLTQDQIDALANRPQGPGSAINLLHLSPDIDTRARAKMALFYDFTRNSGMWKRDKPVTFAEMTAGAKKLLDTQSAAQYSRWVKKNGKQLTAEQSVALDFAHNELMGKVREAEVRLSEMRDPATYTEAQLEAARKAVIDAQTEQVLAATQVSATGTSQGRALASRRIEKERLDPQLELQNRVRNALFERFRTRMGSEKAGPKADELTTKFMDIWRQRLDGEEFLRAYHSVLNAKPIDKVLEWYKMGLLGYPSEIANVASNSLMMAARQMESAVAAAMDWTRVKLTGGEREIFLGEMSLLPQIVRRSMGEALPKFMREMRDNLLLKPQDMSMMLQHGALAEDLFNAAGSIGGKLGELVRYHGKNMVAEDQLAKHFASTDYLYRNIYRKVRQNKEGFRANAGEDARAATERYVQEARTQQMKRATNDPTLNQALWNKHEDMLLKAREYANEATFQSDLPGWMRGIGQVLHDHPWLQIFVPFYRTPSNIAIQTVERTPLGFAMIAKRWKGLSKAERMTELAKPTVGTAIMGLAATMAMSGELNGGGPADFESQDALKAMGWTPYAAKVGSEWISYQRLEPVASLIGFAADMVEAGKRGETQNMGQLMQKAIDSLGQNLLNKTFLVNMEQLFSAMSHPQQYGKTFVKQLQGSIIPNSIGFVPVAHLARALDPVYRQTEPLSADVFLNRIPFASQRLAPQYGPTGEERTRTGTAVERLVSPFTHTTEQSTDKALATREIVRLQAVPKSPLKWWTSPQGFKVPLKPEERQRLAKALDTVVTTIGQRLLKDPSYQRLPDDENSEDYKFGQKTKQQVLKNLIDKYRNATMQQLKPALQKRAYDMYKDQSRG